MKNTPPHVKLTLPDGSRLTAVAYSQEDYPGINLYLSREGHPEELICFVEFNRERQAGENICIGVYQPDMANNPNCDTNEPPLSLGGSLCAKGVHPPMSNELQI